MTGEVRFGEHHHTGNAAGAGKFVPLEIGEGMQRHLADEVREESVEFDGVLKRTGITPVRFDDPLTSASKVHCS